MDITVDLPDHPRIPGIKRKAHYQSINISNVKKEVLLIALVRHYNQQDELLNDIIQDIPVRMVASMQTRVTAQGVLIEQQYEKDADGNIVFDSSGRQVETQAWMDGTPEWTFLDNLAKSSDFDIYGIIQATMTQRAAAGRFEDIY